MTGKVYNGQIANANTKGKVYQVNIVGGGASDFQLKVMPEASAEYKGRIVEYVGPTNEDYVNGYFYKCLEDGSYTAVVEFENSKIAVSNTASLVSLMKEVNPDEYMDVVMGTMVYYTAAELWSFDGMDANGNVLVHYQQYTDDWEAIGFVFTGEFEDEEEIGFDCTMTQVSADYEWVEKEVQALDLTQIDGYDATKTQTLKHDTNKFKWVDD